MALPLTASGERRALPGPRPSRRDDQARETKRRLIGATVGLLAEVGWRRTTIEQIAERAGVAKGTFFVHFKTKEAIVLTLVEAQIGAASAARDVALANGGTAVDGLRAATMALGKHAAASIELSRAVLIASLESREVGSATDAAFTQLHTRMIEDASEALDQGLLEGPDAETVASLLMASYLGAALHCASAPRAKPLAEVLTPLVDAALVALTPSRPRGAPAKKTAARKTKTTRTTPKRRGAPR
ncbi:MAG TPA: TetR/AcrR family transcriptional regulator [Labilithrix sp.]|nr:TetR/AcrR family transcriptional regulator [Labilithrix sp.]